MSLRKYYSFFFIYFNLCFLQLWIYAIPAGVTFITTIIAFWYNDPPIPPAPSGERDHIPSFWRGILDVSFFFSLLNKNCPTETYSL